MRGEKELTYRLIDKAEVITGASSIGTSIGTRMRIGVYTAVQHSTALWLSSYPAL